MRAQEPSDSGEARLVPPLEVSAPPLTKPAGDRRKSASMATSGRPFPTPTPELPASSGTNDVGQLQEYSHSEKPPPPASQAVVSMTLKPESTRMVVPPAPIT